MKIQTLDNTVFDIDPQIAELSGLLRTIVCVDPNETDGVVDLNVDCGPTMSMIVSYLKHYSGTQNFSKLCRPLYTSDLRDAGANEFDLSLLANASFDDVKSLLVASDFLDIPSLTELCCAKLASVIKSIPLEQMMVQTGQMIDDCD